MEYCNYTWDRMIVDTSWLTNKIKSSNIEYGLVLGLTRGGLIPAVVLSHRIGVPMETVQWSFRDTDKQNSWALNGILNFADPSKRILVVDDICDSGKTLVSLFEYMNRCYYYFAGFDSAVLINNTSQPFKPTYCPTIIDRNHDKRWITFPWENKP